MGSIRSKPDGGSRSAVGPGIRRLGLSVLLVAITGSPVLEPTPAGWASEPTRPASLHAAPSAGRGILEDFDGDGIRDLAVGVPGEDLDTGTDVGALSVIYGSPDGPTGDGDQLLRQGTGGVPGLAEPGDEFGATVASGDLDGDGYLDAVVGAPGEDLAGAQDAGSIVVLYGSASGLVTAGSQMWTENSFQGLAIADTGEHFGAHLRTGDFDGDLFDDLAIAAPEEDVGSAVDAGAVFVLYGSAAGLTVGRAQLWTLNSPGIPGIAEMGDGFGSALAAGSSFDIEGFADLAVGVPGKDVSGMADAGGVSIIRGSPTGLKAGGSEAWTEDTEGVQGTAEAGDRFGAALTADGFDGAEPRDLAIGAPGEDVGSIIGAGEIHVLFGSDPGLTSAGNEIWNENSAGVVGTSETGDGFGDLALDRPGRRSAVRVGGRDARRRRRERRRRRGGHGAVRHRRRTDGGPEPELDGEQQRRAGEGRDR